MPIRTILALSLSVILLAGCGRNSHELETAPVRGKVLLDGKPLSSGILFVMPSKGRSAKGLIKQDGTFELMTYSEGDGAQVGTHPAFISPVPRDEMDHLNVKESVEIPARYSSHLTSGIEIEVRSDTDNSPVIQLISEETRQK